MVFNSVVYCIKNGELCTLLRLLKLRHNVCWEPAQQKQRWWAVSHRSARTLMGCINTRQLSLRQGANLRQKFSQEQEPSFILPEVAFIKVPLCFHTATVL